VPTFDSGAAQPARHGEPSRSPASRRPARPEPVLRSQLPDVAHLSLTELRAAADDTLLAGVDRVLSRVQPTDAWLANASRRFD
jgi:hypothetical protein